ncbi:MAG: hypothetical protein EOP84_03475 [Verrucomicrobiaceae bacterium]|nr:MAG: hypothetical protein EOP84_03475 [Verrucomicrobiaceae bacterium]
MLFPYIQPRHGMRQMHAFVKFIFIKVWCRAPGTEYSVDLFQGMRGLHEIMLRLDQEDKAGKEKGAGAFFYKKVNEIVPALYEIAPDAASMAKLEVYPIARCRLWPPVFCCSLPIAA